ncbi:MAG TPA: spore coat protein U domain-containing protein [Gammaproteobacteria bacterium]|nr:spore coat protein U domain-containing protein [Gammaproteobacteria bacterium]
MCPGRDLRRQRHPDGGTRRRLEQPLYSAVHAQRHDPRSTGPHQCTGAARTAIWGDGTGGGVPVTQAFNNNRVRLSVYGRIPAMEDIAPGSDTDHITATVTY